MTLVLVRVDCRLIHGQVIEAWVPYTKADCLVVANDEAAGDIMQQTIMTMAVPPNIEVAICGVKEAAQDLNNGKWAKKKVILLLADLHDARTCLQSGLRFNLLNLGNLFAAPGKKQVTECVCLDQEDLEHLNEFRHQGIDIDARSVPREQSRNLYDIISTCRQN